MKPKQNSMKITKIFRFEAAHYLPNVPNNHKCGAMHGHSYTVEVSVEGKVAESSGWVMDFADISGRMKPLVKKLDHQTLNSVSGLGNPTAENLAIWFWDKLKEHGWLDKDGFPGLCEIAVRETGSGIVTYTGD